MCWCSQESGVYNHWLGNLYDLIAYTCDEKNERNTTLSDHKHTVHFEELRKKKWMMKPIMERSKFLSVLLGGGGSTEAQFGREYIV